MQRDLPRFDVVVDRARSHPQVPSNRPGTASRFDHFSRIHGVRVTEQQRLRNPGFQRLRIEANIGADTGVDTGGGQGADTG